jgi:hypothetical protein
LIFVRETSDPLTSLVKKIDQRLEAVTAKTPRNMGVFVIFDSKAEGLDNRLREIAAKEGLKRVSLCIGAPPPDYEVAAAADLTAAIYNPARRPEQKVKANFALRKGELDTATADAIVKALGDVLPK